MDLVALFTGLTVLLMLANMLHNLQKENRFACRVSVTPLDLQERIFVLNIVILAEEWPFSIKRIEITGGQISSKFYKKGSHLGDFSFVHSFTEELIIESSSVFVPRAEAKQWIPFSFLIKLDKSTSNPKISFWRACSFLWIPWFIKMTLPINTRS